MKFGQNPAVIRLAPPDIWWRCPECGGENVERGYDWPGWNGQPPTPPDAGYEEWLQCQDCEIDRDLQVTWCPLSIVWFEMIKCG